MLVNTDLNTFLALCMFIISYLTHFMRSDSKCMLKNIFRSFSIVW